MYTYKDFVTGRLRRTRGVFKGYTKGGPLGATYAIFANRSSDVLVPIYCLTPKTKERLGEVRDRSWPMK